MCGDWPVSNLGAPYGAVKQLVADCLAQESDDARRRVFGATAIEFYSLNVA